MELYSANAERAIHVLREHPALFTSALRLVATGAIFAQDILRLYTLKSYGVAAGALHLDANTLDEGLSLAREFARLSHNKEFDHMIRRIEEIFSMVPGMTATQVLDVLAVENPR